MESGKPVASHLIKNSKTISFFVPFFIIISIFALAPFLDDTDLTFYPVEEKENFKNLSFLDEETSKEIKFYGCLQYLNLFTYFHIRNFNKNVYANTKNPLKLTCNSLLIPRSPPTPHCSLI